MPTKINKKILLTLCLLPLLAKAYGTIGFNQIGSNGGGATGVTDGGTGATTLTPHGALIGEGTSPVAVTPAMGNGGLLIGAGTGADPSTGTLTGTTNQVSVANAAGSVTLSLPTALVAPGTVTVAGNAFSVGGSSFSVSGGSVTTAYLVTAGSFSGIGTSLTALNPANISAGSLGTGVIVSSIAASTDMLGVKAGGSACAGCVGEILSGQAAGNQTPAVSGSFVSLATATLTSGDWLIWATCTGASGGTTAASQTECCISATAAGCDSGTGNGQTANPATVNVSDDVYLNTGPRHVNITTTTSYYVTGRLNYTVLGGFVWNINSYISGMRIR